MDPYKSYTLTILFTFSLLTLKGIHGDSSVLFIDSPTIDYFRHSAAKTTTLSPSEIGAAASVLLGFAPSSTLTADSSSKLNKVLIPRPFDPPRAVLMLEVAGVAEDSQLVLDSDKSAFGSAIKIKVAGDERVDIQLPSEDQVSLVSLNEVSSDTECSDKELSDFASWLGGSYVEDASGPLKGELILPMSNDESLRLHMSQRADREYATGLVLIIDNIKRAIEIHQVLSKSENAPAEMISGRFGGIKALHDHYGSDGIAQNGLEVFVTSISKAFDYLHAEYQGRIVGVIVPVSSESESTFHVTVDSHPSARFLEEKEASIDPMKIAEVIFVRTVLAWITGIILLIATILAIYFLMNMPITKDTLLYSNVKLD